MKVGKDEIVLVDSNAIDVDALADIDWPESMAGGLLIPVRLQPGQTLDECFYRMDKELAKEILESIVNS